MDRWETGGLVWHKVKGYNVKSIKTRRHTAHTQLLRKKYTHPTKGKDVNGFFFPRFFSLSRAGWFS